MRHDFDAWSMLLGLAFGAIAVAGLSGRLDDVFLDPATWSAAVVVPVMLILLGVVVGAFALSMLRRRRPVDAATDPVAGDRVDA